MLTVFDSLRGLELIPVIFRVFLSMICGSIIGLERSAKNRPAGFRTHALVCVGAAAASMTGHYLYLGMGIPADVTRMGAQIITGLGFLGAGTILVTKNKKVKGLTTAAGLWTTGIIGLSIGAGFYEGGIICTVLVLVTELLLSWLVNGLKRDSEITVRVVYTKKNALDQMMRYCKDKNLSIKRLQVNSHGDNSMYHADVLLHAPWNAHPDELIKHIYTIDGIHSVEQVTSGTHVQTV